MLVEVVLVLMPVEVVLVLVLVPVEVVLVLVLVPEEDPLPLAEAEADEPEFPLVPSEDKVPAPAELDEPSGVVRVAQATIDRTRSEGRTSVTT